ncbi:MAG: putative hydroxymethylpyrimidine transport system substrate-binding protein [Solirubrobacterales bacterium]|jgi:putative hydroxymethylpyrimidine transport system substrate-binding protein|nr:putative hydroxymethylpyrimidine transport system substrate-binding protein [Solirubrobacterales bacterium]
MKPPRLVALATTVAALILALGLAACGEKSEDGTGASQSFSLALDFYPNPDHAGIYMAEELGYYKEAGLDVGIEAPTDPSLPIKQVAAGRTDLAISYEPEVILAREEGLDVIAIAALVNRPLTSMIWLSKSGINGVPSLKGKTIAYAGIPYQEAFLETILARGGLTTGDVKAVNVGFNLLPALVGGSADAMLGGFQNVEGVDLRERGLKPVVSPVDQLGVPTYDELVLVANRETLEAEPEKFRLFLAALERGTDAAVAQPNAATQAILSANQTLEPKLTKAEVEATLPLLGARVEGQPYGYMDPAAWDEFAGWMRDNELIDSLPNAAQLLSNDYLPGKIPE